MPSAFALPTKRVKLSVMPAKSSAKSLHDVVEEVGLYPPEAYLFVRQGLTFTVEKVHEKTDPQASHHVGGRELCEGLRELALQQWGLLARMVLSRWNITSTMDFGRIVFALVDHDLLQKTEEDQVEDFRQVYDFKAAFDASYRIEPKIINDQPKRAERKA